MDKVFTKINIGLYGDGKKSKYKAREIYCENCDKCGLYKDGTCLRVVRGFSDNNCKYGRIRVIDGYTTRAQKCSSWLSGVRNSEYYHKLDYPDNAYAAIIGDFVWLNLIYTEIWERTKENRRCEYERLGWQVSERRGFSTGACFVPKSALTPELLERALTFRPHALMGGEIETYRTKIVPQVITDLRKICPELIAKVLEINPALDVAENYIGRKVYINSLKVGTVLKEKVNGIVTATYTLTMNTHNGKLYLKGKCYQWHFGGNRQQDVEIEVTDDMTYVVDDSSMVTTGTKFA